MKKLIIVGGGTAGWLSAAYLSSKLTNIEITLVESSDIPTVGVGEATTPSLRATLADIGVDEFSFMRACHATFKHGILFSGWADSPRDAQHNGYFHPFERPLRAGTEGLENFWLRGLGPKEAPFADVASIQFLLARNGLSPKSVKDKPYASPIPYAYHLDAGLLAEALKSVALQRGVVHTIDTVTAVNTGESGAISSLSLASSEGLLHGDFFVDCSGFSARLIDGHYAAAFEDYSHILLCDRAVTCQIPISEDESIDPYTHSTAQENGWIWDIALSNRRGVGFVYASRYMNDEDAERCLNEYLVSQQKSDGRYRPDKPPATRVLKFPVGFRREQWLHNCAAVGLSSGFIEPLESTGIHLVEQSLWALASMLPRYFSGGAPQSQFNRTMSSHYEMAIQFVKFHYAISRRRDTAFWRDNCDPSSWTPWLEEKINQWRYSSPDVYDLEALHSIFDHASYQYVLFGMNVKPQVHGLTDHRDAFAKQVFERVAAGAKKAQSVLPSHKQLLAQIHAGGDGALRVPGYEAHAVVSSSIRNMPSNYSVR